MEQNSSSQGPVVGIVIVLAVLVVGAFYFLARLSFTNAPSAVDTATTSDTAGFPPVSSSDDPDAIARDLDSTDVDDLDADLSAIDAELSN